MPSLGGSRRSVGDRLGHGGATRPPLGGLPHETHVIDRRRRPRRQRPHVAIVRDPLPPVVVSTPPPAPAIMRDQPRLRPGQARPRADAAFLARRVHAVLLYSPRGFRHLDRQTVALVTPWTTRFQGDVRQSWHWLGARARDPAGRLPSPVLGISFRRVVRLGDALTGGRLRPARSGRRPVVTWNRSCYFPFSERSASPPRWLLPNRFSSRGGQRLPRRPFPP